MTISTGYQPRNTPAERRAFYDQLRKQGDYVAKSGDTMTGPLILPGSPDPASNSFEAITADYYWRWLNLMLSTLPKGKVARAAATTNQGSITAAVDLTGLTVSWTAAPSRLYRITASVNFSNTNANTFMQVGICDASNNLKQALNIGTAIAGFAFSQERSVLETGLSGSTTRKLRATGAGLANTATLVASATTPAFILVEDIGPA